jgi:uncharacterized membrane protein
MHDAPKVLFAGESWVTHSVHVKGADSFETSSYHEGGTAMIEALRSEGVDVTYQPCHVAADSFPFDMDTLSQFDVIVLSDIGANTFLLPQRTFVRSEPTPNRLQLIRDFVLAGGGLLMVGGYMSFQGIGAKANYRGSPVEEVLPVRLLAGDDRQETPQGLTPEVVDRDHPILSGLSEWPQFLGYNRMKLAERAHLVAGAGADPFIAVAEPGKGRTAVFASDCGPHWGPPEFLAWPGYSRLWCNLIRWLAHNP